MWLAKHGHNTSCWRRFSSFAVCIHSFSKAIKSNTFVGRWSWGVGRPSSFPCYEGRQGMIEYIYASCFRVSIPCNHHLPIASGVEIAQINSPVLRAKDDFPKLSKIFLQAAKILIHRTQPVSCVEVCKSFTPIWSLALIQYPGYLLLVGLLVFMLAAACTTFITRCQISRWYIIDRLWRTTGIQGTD